MNKKNQRKLKEIQLPTQLRPCTNLLEEILKSSKEDSDLINIQFEKITLDNEIITRNSFENIFFHSCNFTETDFSRCSFRNVLFENCSFSACNFSSGWFSQCAMKDSQFQGCDFTETRLMDLSVSKSRLCYTNFTSSVFDGCEITQSDLSEAFFAECKWKEVSLTESQLVRTEFFKTPLKSIDFTTCTIDGIRVSEHGPELFGAIVTTMQAADLSRLLGLVIRDS